jgi:hypothetical protein
MKKAEDCVSSPADWWSPNASGMRVRDKREVHHLQWMTYALLEWKYEISWLSSHVMGHPNAVLGPPTLSTTNANVHKCIQI